MRILIISDVTGYMLGGVVTETLHLIRGLRARGHVVALAGDVVPRGAAEVQHFKVGIPTNSRIRDEVAQAIEAFAPDFIHVMAMNSRGIASLAPVLMPHCWAMTCHSLPPHERKLSCFHASERLHYAARWLRFSVHATAWKFLLRWGGIPTVIVHSETMRRVVTRYGAMASRTSCIPLGCDLEPVGGEPVAALRDNPRIVTIAGLAHTKGQHDAIAAIADLRRDHPGLQYQLIGEVRDKSYLSFLQDLIERSGLRDAVVITPRLSRDEVQRALRNADLYLQPSHEEGFCLAYIEAASIVPRLVGADTGAIRLIGMDDAGARTVPVRRPAQLAAAMRELLGTPLPSDLMARRAERLSARFGWSQYLDAHESLYREAVTRKSVEPTKATSASDAENA